MKASNKNAKKNGLDKNNLSPEEEVTIYQVYARAMESNPEGAREADIQILTRTYGVVKGVPQEKISTRKEPRPPVFDDDKLKSYKNITIKLSEGLEKIDDGYISTDKKNRMYYDKLILTILVQENRIKRRIVL